MFRPIQFLFIVGMILCTSDILAQRPGLLPPSVKWQQIKHDSLRIIFPEGEEERANRIATVMLRLASKDPVTLNGRYRPISVLLQPETNISNGYVQLAPYMSEFYLQPNENPFTLGSIPWHDLLAIHEFRHVQQINSANRSLSHIVKLIFGDFAFSGMYSLSIPNWFREGDAVNAETKWTNQGRGRLSSFTLPFHEKLLQGRTWNFYKLRNGSYKEFTPDFYSMGYMMVQFGDHVFKEETWDSIVQIAPTFRHLTSPFSGTMKEIYGKKNKLFYLDAMEWYAGRWEGNTEKDIIYPLVSMDLKDMADDFFDMAYPCVSKHGTVYATVSTFDHTEAIYKFNPDGTKEKVISLGIQQDPYFDYKNHRLVWTELRFDPRWNRRDKNVIVVLDEETGKKFSIEPRKGFFTPSLDKNGNRIVALHVDQEGNNQLQILDAKNGGLLATLPNPDNLYLGYPIWSENELSIIATARDKEGRMAIVEEDIATGVIKLITHYSYNVLGRPFLHENWIYITTTLDTLDQVYAVDRNEGIFYRLTQGSTAHYDPTWDETRQEIVCSEYRLNGKKLIRIPGAPSASWKLKGLNDGIKNIIGREENLLAPSTYKPTFVNEKYSHWSNAINVHSWTLTYDDPYIGTEVRSDNIMNSISLAGGFEYNANARAMGPYFNARLGMWYPVISFGVSRIFRDTTYDDGNNYRETNDYIDIGASLPLLFSRGVWQQAVNLSSTYFAGFSRVRPVTPEEEDFRFNFLKHRIVLSNALLRSYRQVLPSFGQRLEVSYSDEVVGVQLSQLFVSTHLAFPGIMPSHSLLLQGELLSQDISEHSIIASSPYEGARGFNETDGEKQYHVGLTYEFPIWYPDFGLGTIFYCRRVRLQPFYDVAYTDDGSTTRWMQSTGVEMVLDIKFPPIALGFRYSKLLAGHTGGNTNVFEFFIPALVF